MKKSQILIILVLGVLLLAACGGTPVSDVGTTAPTASEVIQATQSDESYVSPTYTPVPPRPTPTPGFKDPNLCPDSDAGVPVPERLPNAQWSAVDSPSDGKIWAVEALSSTDIWAVGEHGSILHYDGVVWTAMSSPTHRWLRGISMLSADEGWAVGGDISGSVILHYANQLWSIVDAPAHVFLMDVDFVAPDRGWAVGEGILYYDENNWIVFSSEELVLQRNVDDGG